MNLLVGYDLPASGFDDLARCAPEAIERMAPNSVDSITLFRCIERMNGIQRVLFLNECYKAMKPGAVLEAMAHAWSSDAAYADPRVVWPPVTAGWFRILSRVWRHASGEDYGDLANLPLHFEGENVQVKVISDPEYCESLELKSDEFKAHAARYSLNFVQQYHFTLTKPSEPVVDNGD